MENMELYNRYREVPPEAKKPIEAGRIKGKTDINPMWRIKCLTEAFGACGVGWYYEIEDKQLKSIDNSDEVAAFVDIKLFVKVNGEWSKPIHGTGGNMFTKKERSGVYMSDECFKMATTDALSVACKQLGIGADVYWSSDRTKYEHETPLEDMATVPQMNQIKGLCTDNGINYSKLLEMKHLKEPLTGVEAGALLQYIRIQLEKQRDK